MMNETLRKLIISSVTGMVNEAASDRKIREGFATHLSKVHFVPASYRVLGGILQALNIKFGNFIEDLIGLVVENDPGVEVLSESGKKIPLSMTQETDALIDSYITKRQLPDSPDQCDDQFYSLLASILDTENRSDAVEKQTITKDVDILFRSQRTGRVVYLEVKYNDDHDTGKFVDINRKFLKTYAGLVNHLGTTAIDDINPIIYYFNPTKRYGPIYVPSTHILRGRQLFDVYFETKYEDIDQQLKSIGEDKDIVGLFDDLYNRIRKPV
jgi:hypothetical protein